MAGFVILFHTPESEALGDRVYANRDVARRASRRLNDDLARLGFGSAWYSEYADAPQGAVTP